MSPLTTPQTNDSSGSIDRVGRGMTRLLVGRIPHEQPCPGVFYRALLRSDRALAGAVVAHAESSGTTASCEAGESWS